jgi:hypothetical protein
MSRLASNLRVHSRMCDLVSHHHLMIMVRSAAPTGGR